MKRRRLTAEKNSYNIRGMSRKIAVLFPGVRYSVDCPLLYFPAMVYSKQGFEIIKITDYQVTSQEDGLKQLEQYAKEATKSVVNQLANIDWKKEDQIVFVEKSVGTVIGMGVEDELAKNGFEGTIHHIVLTPIKETFPLMRKGRVIDYMVTGELDDFLDQKELKELCDQNQFEYDLIPGVGHRLEVAGDVSQSLAILDELVKKLRP